MTNYDEYVAEKLKNPKYKVEWDALEPEFAVIHAMIEARKNMGITQQQLSSKTGINQSDISRIESGDANPTLATLKRLAAGMNMKLKLEFLPISEQQEVRA